MGGWLLNEQRYNSDNKKQILRLNSYDSLAVQLVTTGSEGFITNIFNIFKIYKLAGRSYDLFFTSLTAFTSHIGDIL
jgi:hypothetical protein